MSAIHLKPDHIGFLHPTLSDAAAYQNLAVLALELGTLIRLSNIWSKRWRAMAARTKSTRCMRRSGNIPTEPSTNEVQGGLSSKLRKYGRICDDIVLDSVNIWGLTPEGDRFRLNLRVRSSYPNRVGEAYSCLPGDGTV